MPAVQTNAMAGRPPNIVLILTDDQRADEFGFMPNVQAIGAAGAFLPLFYVSNSSCCPSRSTILRGAYSRNTGVHRNEADYGGWATFNSRGEEAGTIATTLQAAGYATGLFGKYLNGYNPTPAAPYVPPGWSRWLATFAGTYYDYTANNDGVLASHGASASDFQPTVIGDAATSWIAAQSAANRPFLAYIAPNPVHDDSEIGEPPQYEPQYETWFTDEVAPRDGSFNEADVSDKPDYVSILPLLTDTDIASVDVIRRARLRSLQSVDVMVARIVAALAAAGQLANTYIFVTSDNGYMLGQHRFHPPGKILPYEESIRMSAYVRGPGIAPGQTLPFVCGNVDLSPTFSHIANLAQPSWIDGRTMLPYLRGNAVPQTDRAYPVEGWRPYSTDFWVSGFHTSTYKYLEYITGERELYDLVNDPDELNNLAGSKPTDVLAAYLAQMEVSSGDACRRLENNPPARPW